MEISEKDRREIEESTALLLIENYPGRTKEYGSFYHENLYWCGIDENVFRRLERKGMVLVHISGRGCYVKKHYYAASNAPA